MVLTQVFPQNLLLSFTTQPPQTFLGMPWFDATNAVFKFDSTGSGDFVAALPQHTTTGEHGPKVTIDQTSADNALVVLKSNVGTGVAFQLTNEGTGTGLNLIQNGSAQALGITQNADQLALSVVKVPGGIGDAAFIENQSGTGQCLHIVQSANGKAVFIENAGTNVGLTVNQSGAGNPAAVIAKSSVDINNALEVRNSGTGNGIFLEQDSAAGNALLIVNSGASAAISVQNTGNGTMCQMEQAGNGIGMLITKSDTNGLEAAVITNAGTGRGLLINQNGNAAGLRVVQNGQGAAIEIVKSSSTGAALSITHSSTDSTAEAVVVINSSSDSALKITHVANAALIDLVNNAPSSTARDIQNDSGSWFIDKSGNATFNSVTQTGASLSMFEVVIAPTSGAGAQGSAKTTLAGATSFTDVPGITMSPSFTGGVVKVEAFFQCEAVIYAGFGSGPVVRMRILQDGGVLNGSHDAVDLLGFAWTSTWQGLHSVVHVNVTPGVHTFKMQYLTTHNGGGNPLPVTRRELRVTEVDYAIGSQSITNF